MDPSSIEKMERNMRALGATIIGQDAENNIWQLPNGMRWPVPKLDQGVVLSKEQKIGKVPIAKKQIIIRTPSPIVERPLIPVMPERVVVEEREEFLVRRVEATNSHFVNRAVPTKKMKSGRQKGEKNKDGACHSLSPGFLEEANKILRERGKAAVEEFIKHKRDVWGTR